MTGLVVMSRIHVNDHVYMLISLISLISIRIECVGLQCRHKP